MNPSSIPINHLLRKALIAAFALSLIATASCQGLGYKAEQKRFEKVLQQASDDELFLVLNYAIAHHFVPNREIDPFYNVHVMVGCWQRSLKVYNKLSDRKDLLQEIYPDLEVLDKYVKWGWQTGQPYPDTMVSQTILNNVRKDIKQLDSLMGSPSYKESLEYKYYGTPLMRERIVVSHRKSVQ
jgi:hypothetical protein